MYPDSLMPIQGTSLSTSSQGARPWRVAVLVAAALMLAALFVLPRMNSTAPTYRYSACVCPAYSASYSIVTLCRIGRAADAVDVADSALSNVPADSYEAANLYFLRGGALRLLGRYSEAKADYAEAADIAAPYVSPDSRMELLAQSGDVSTLSELAQQSLSDNADNPYAVNNACWELAIYTDGSAAKAAQLMKPVAENSNNGAWIDTYAWTLYLSGDQQGAVQQEERAIQNIQSEDADHIAYYHACLEGMEGNRAEAAQDLQQIFQDNIMFTSAWAAANQFAVR
ncbi:MAG TPA: hypothetical protein VFJ58_03640 [Armatimonadota bacterium]|nr:hypothetical protein [Armatimonadota bacterium]